MQFFANFSSVFVRFITKIDNVFWKKYFLCQIAIFSFQMVRLKIRWNVLCINSLHCSTKNTESHPFIEEKFKF
jgi:hypothetical protein